MKRQPTNRFNTGAIYNGPQVLAFRVISASRESKAEPWNLKIWLRDRSRKRAIELYVKAHTPQVSGQSVFLHYVANETLATTLTPTQAQKI